MSLGLVLLGGRAGHGVGAAREVDLRGHFPVGRRRQRHDRVDRVAFVRKGVVQDEALSVFEMLAIF